MIIDYLGDLKWLIKPTLEGQGVRNESEEFEPLEIIDSRRFIMKDKKFKTVDFPLSRIATIDIGAVGFTKHHMRALVEFDVTDGAPAFRALTNLKELIEKGHGLPDPI